jgi:integrase
MIPKGAKKPKWPYPGKAPGMFPAGNGQWAKKIRGHRYNFGPWADPKGALELYLSEKDALHNGDGRIPPPPDPSRLTVGELVARFLKSKMSLIANGELSARMYDDYRRVGKKMIESFGDTRLVPALGPSDFAHLRAKLGPSKSRLGNEIIWVRSFFKWAGEENLIKTVISFGQGFKRPKAGDVRKAKNTRGRKRLYRPEEVAWLVVNAGPLLKAMVLLAINGGFGNTDCSALALEDVSLSRGVIENVRHKTGSPRTVPLWPETVAALKEWMVVRPKPTPSAAAFVFVTATGLPLVQVGTGPDPEHRDGIKTTKTDWVAREFNAFVRGLGLPGKTFYDLRHTFRTVAESGAFKERTISRVMGHIQSGIGSEYIHDFSHAKLKAVTDHVRAWYLTGHLSPVASGASAASDTPSALPSGVSETPQ